MYLGSHFGDSQLLQISPFPVSSSECPTLPIPGSVRAIKPKDLGMVTKVDDDVEEIVVNGIGSYLIEIESFSNLAPIVDGILVDADNGGPVCNVLGFRALLILLTE